MFCVKKVVVNMDVEIYFNRKTLMEDYRMSEKTIETALLTGTYRGSMFVEIDIEFLSGGFIVDFEDVPVGGHLQIWDQGLPGGAVGVAGAEAPVVAGAVVEQADHADVVGFVLEEPGLAGGAVTAGVLVFDDDEPVGVGGHGGDSGLTFDGGDVSDGAGGGSGGVAVELPAGADVCFVAVGIGFHVAV